MKNKKDLKSIQVQQDKLIAENVKLRQEVDSLLLDRAEIVKNQKREKLFNKIEEMRLRVNSLKREKAKLESELRKSLAIIPSHTKRVCKFGTGEVSYELL